MSWVWAFLFTQAVEIPIYLAAMHRQRVDRPWRARAAIAFGATALTHPIVWYVLPWLGLPYWVYVGVAEAFAVVAEGLYLGAFDLRRALLWSLLANGASAGLGLTSRALFSFP